jgi:hypothetical protein
VANASRLAICFLVNQKKKQQEMKLVFNLIPLAYGKVSISTKALIFVYLLHQQVFTRVIAEFLISFISIFMMNHKK